jgi:hypothetical protein
MLISQAFAQGTADAAATAAIDPDILLLLCDGHSPAE